MSIVLTHSYFLYDDDKEAKIMKPYPPLGLLYISGYLESKGVKNNVFDTTFSSVEKQLAFLKEKKSKTIAIYTNLMTKINVIKLIKVLKTDEQYGFPFVVLGGPDLTYNCNKYLKAGADYLILGEGEQTMFELYKVLETNGEAKEVTGIAYKESDEFIKTPARVKIKDLSELPLPNRKAIDINKYLDTWKEYHGMSSMTISTQRGCPYTCKWCSTAVYGQSYRRRPVNLVVQEIKELQRQYNPDALWFVDDVFTVSHKWLSGFHAEMIKENIKIPFECITRAERLNSEVLQQLKEIGCYRIWIGAESGSQKIVDAMDRRVDVTVVQDTIREANSLGIETGTFIMVGYPGEDEEDVQQTIQHLKRANPTHFTITVAYPIKGTSLYNEIEKEIITKLDWEKSTDREIDFKRKYNRSFYNFAVRRIINEIKYFKKEKGRWKYKIKSVLSLLGMKFHKMLS